MDDMSELDRSIRDAEKRLRAVLEKKSRAHVRIIRFRFNSSPRFARLKRWMVKFHEERFMKWSRLADSIEYKLELWKMDRSVSTDISEILTTEEQDGF